jgi:hypothetical protein
MQFSRSKNKANPETYSPEWRSSETIAKPQRTGRHCEPEQATEWKRPDMFQCLEARRSASVEKPDLVSKDRTALMAISL